MNGDATPTTTASPWPHCWAWLLCCTTFPLVWVGGLITTTDAGMAVPDWPGTYGYNLFLYPWQTWLFGPWDLFIEHGHRLLASLVGLLTIGLVVVVWRNDRRPWLRKLAIAALLLVILQGVLGGLRVVMNARHLALLHGSTGPLFFGLTAAIVVLTGRGQTSSAKPASGGWVAWLLPLTVYCQLVLGATLRHTPETGGFNTFAWHVVAHLVGAAAVLIAVSVAGALSLRREALPVRRLLGGMLAGLVLVQVTLGVATWVAKYRLPAWAQEGVAADAWAAVVGPGTISPSVAGGWTETHVVTGHSAVGSLLLALSVGWAMAGRWAPAEVSPRSDSASEPHHPSTARGVP